MPVDTAYHDIQVFSMYIHKKEIISQVESIHKDEMPLISFISIEGNKNSWTEFKNQ